MRNFIAAIGQSLSDASFVKLNLGNYKGTEDLKKIHVRKIMIKREEMLSFTYQHKTRDIVKNYTPQESLYLINDLLKNDFGSAALFTTDFDLSFPQMKKTKPTQKASASLNHDRSKNRIVETKGKAYLRDLKITDDAGKVLKSSQAKYRQIDKYIEILSGLIKPVPPEKLKKIVDMGSGKGYLTFALYDYLANTLKVPVHVEGVEYRADMVDLCNDIAQKSSFTGLNFVQGTIESYDAADTNILIALHACDTATDDAIAKGIKCDANLIVVAPCCHNQISNQMGLNFWHRDLGFLLRHGILFQRQAEMVTDAMRALILEYYGYHVKVFEFISDEHTPKNVMIVAIKIMNAKNQQSLQEFIEAKKYFGIGYHHLEKIMELS